MRLAAMITLVLAGPLAFCADTPKPQACSAPEFHQFDFWIGYWDAFEAGSSSSEAHCRVERILEGCVLREDYQDKTGQHGQSLTIYDATRKIWHQTWVTNRGELLMVEGTLEGGAMVLGGSDHTADGKERLVRGTWQPVSGGVREFASRSLDGGRTWTQWFDITFRRHTQSHRTQ